MENNRDINIEKLIHATKENDKGAVKKMIAKGANVKATGSEGWTPLIHAAYLNYLEIVKILVGEGADIDEFQGKWNAFLYAVWYQHTEIVKFFIESGANINIADLEKETPLMYSAWNGNEEIVDMLIKAGADVNARNKSGWTALHESAWGGYVNIMKILIAAGADINKKDNLRRSSIHVFKECYGNFQADRKIEAPVEECIKNLKDFAATVNKIKEEDSRNSVETGFEFDI